MTEVRRIGTTTDLLGEGPVWCPIEQALYWVDIRAPAVRRWTQATGLVTTWEMPEQVGSLALREAGGILVALRSAVAVFHPASGRIEKFADAPNHPADMRFNDGKCDRQGRFWVGTMGLAGPTGTGRLYRFDAAGCTEVLDGIDIPNSLCWSADGRTMYFTDSLKRVIWAYPYDPASGALGERLVFARVAEPAIADGGTIDEHGYLWSATYSGASIIRYAPDGRVDREIAMPVGRITACAFGGRNLATLFITCGTQGMTDAEKVAAPLAGALFAIDVGVQGLPEPRFAF